MINRSSKMIENEMKDNQERMVDMICALDNDKDIKHVFRIRDIVIDSNKENNLFNVLDAKYDVEQLLANECENFHRLACNDGNEDEPHKVMKELIMIIVNRYGGAISANTLQHLLGKCKEFGWAVVSLMTSERLSAVPHTDGSPACFFIPSVCDKNS